MEAELKDLRKHVEFFLSNTSESRRLAERCRDYKDGYQYTDEEVSVLNVRKQAPIVINRIKPKVEGLLGLVSMRLSDPKAYPRTRKHEKQAESITDGLRYVTDNNDFQDIKMSVADNFFVEGYGGVIVDVKADGNGKPDVNISHIPWDRLYFDVNSRKKDFSDARYVGVIMWMDENAAEEMFPDIDFDNLLASNSVADETFEDKILWQDNKTKRIRIAQEFYKKDGVWRMCIFTDGMFLVEPIDSPYLDEFGKPSNPIEIISAYIDRQNNRYGEVASFLDAQDEINKRRSKALHLLSQRQTASRKGVIKDVIKLKGELAKPDGHVEYEGERGDFEILQTGDMARGQFELYQDAKAELDAVSFNAQLSGDRQTGDLSGRAIDKLQAAGTIELNGLFTSLNGWEKRVYRQIWARIKQFWTEERWIRITDDVKNLRWVGFNTEMTAQEYLEEIINDTSLPLTQRKEASASYMLLMQNEDPALQTIVKKKNDLAELDVDIILEQSFDSISVQQEQFQALLQFSQGGDIDIIELIELSQLRGKEEVIEKIKKRREEQAQSSQPIQEMAMQSEQVKMAETMSRTELNAKTAQQKQIESAILIASPPDRRPQVST